MSTYQVTIEARVRKTIEVEANSHDEAVEQAHELFTTDCDGDEYYTEETLDVEVSKE